MKKKHALALCLALLLCCTACGSRSGQAAGETAAAGESGSAQAGESWNEGSGMDLSMDSSPQASAPQEEAEGSVYRSSGAKLIRRAELTIQTEDFDQAVQGLQRLTESCGGYFERSSVYGGSYRDANARRSGEYVARIPAENYDRFLTASGDLGYVTQLTESSEDVGEQYYDTQSRLQTQRTKQERLLSLLEKAETMEDIISLENALSETEYQIEQYTSTLNRYDALIGFSTFTIYLNEVSKVTEEVGETASLGSRMAAGFRSSLEGLVSGSRELLVWISYNFVILAVLALAVAVGAVVGWRKYRKNFPAKQKRGKEEPRDPE